MKSCELGKKWRPLFVVERETWEDCGGEGLKKMNEKEREGGGGRQGNGSGSGKTGSWKGKRKWFFYSPDLCLASPIDLSDLSVSFLSSELCVLLCL